jgi:hypothetical protein
VVDHLDETPVGIRPDLYGRHERGENHRHHDTALQIVGLSSATAGVSPNHRLRPHIEAAPALLAWLSFR